MYISSRSPQDPHKITPRPLQDRLKILSRSIPDPILIPSKFPQEPPPRSPQDPIKISREQLPHSNQLHCRTTISREQWGLCYQQPQTDANHLVATQQPAVTDRPQGTSHKAPWNNQSMNLLRATIFVLGTYFQKQPVRT